MNNIELCQYLIYDCAFYNYNIGNFIWELNFNTTPVGGHKDNDTEELCDHLKFEASNENDKIVQDLSHVEDIRRAPDIWLIFQPGNEF